MSRVLRSPLAACLVVSALVFLSVMALRRSGSLESLELAAYDWYIRLRPAPSAPDPRIVLITVGESDIRNWGWPLTDATMARMLTILTNDRPRAIGLDIYRDIDIPPGHEALDAVLTRNPRIIAVMKFDNGLGRGIPPPPVLRNTQQVGFNDIVVDPGGTVRRGLLFLDAGETSAYSFALRLALLYLQAEGITPQPDALNPHYLRLGRTTIRPFEPDDGGYVGADARGYQFLLDFKGARNSFRSFPLSALLSGKVGPAAIRDRVVLVGITAEGVKDFFYTPYSRELKGDQQVSGIALHAHVVSQLLRFGLEANPPVATMSEWQEASLILLWSLLGGLLGLRVLQVRSPWRFSLWAAAGLLALGLAAYVAFLKSWWIPLVPPAMAWAGSAALATAYRSKREREQRALLMQLFSKHVSPEVAETIWRQRDQFLDGGRPRAQKLTATILFADLKGFTAVSEKMDPQALIGWLNTYMETMAQVVMEHGGIIDDYAGDSLMADFGVPLARTTEAETSRDAVNAVSCALAMEGEMSRLNAYWEAQHLPTVGMRIGIYSGPVVAGSLGSAQRLKYTLIGDTVNIASRLESFDKESAEAAASPCRILIGEATLRYLGGQFKTEKVGEVSLKGKDQKITIYRVLGRRAELD